MPRPVLARLPAPVRVPEKSVVPLLLPTVRVTGAGVAALFCKATLPLPAQTAQRKCHRAGDRCVEDHVGCGGGDERAILQRQALSRSSVPATFVAPLKVLAA